MQKLQKLAEKNQIVIAEKKAIRAEKKAAKKEIEKKAIERAKKNSSKRVIKRIRQIVTKSVNDKTQQRTIGSRVVRDEFNNYIHTIASRINMMIKSDMYNKSDIALHCSTKLSRVNAHIAYLNKKNFAVVVDNDTKIVSFR
jgi:hypothetical protein